MGEISTATIERVAAGANTVDLIRPLSDSLRNDHEAIEAQAITPEMVFAAREEGPCGGVEMAEDVMDSLIAFRDEQERSGGPQVGIYANHPPSKGADRAALYKRAGVRFDVPINDIPRGSIYLFSAHGADPTEVEKATALGLHVVDTTCPLVGRIYRHVKRSVQPDEKDIRPSEVGVVYLSGADMDHPEVLGTRGVVRKAGARFIPVTSLPEALELADGGEEIGPEHTSMKGLKRVLVSGLTTNNSDTTQELAEAFEHRLMENGRPSDFVMPYDTASVCRTVKYRQEAIRAMVREKGVMSLVVVGAIRSHNTNSLVGAALDEAAKADPETMRLRRIVFANTWRDIPEVDGVVGLVSGASTGQRNIDQIFMRLGVRPDEVVYIGDRDKDGRFRPLGGSSALARLALGGNFDWFGAQPANSE